MLKNRCLLAALSVGLVMLSSGAASTEARGLRTAVRLEPVASSHAERIEPLPLPAYPVYQPAPCCLPEVYYVNRPCIDPCEPSVVYLLPVCHPCTGCKTAVKVCLPACCTGSPRVRSRNTLFGCGLTRYDWCCGYGVTVRFMKCGDLKVIYH